MNDAKTDSGALGARARSGDDLARRTLRTVALLVAACVLFVGTLSLIAVLVTSKAVGRGVGGEDGAAQTETNSKKPLSI